jgi:hypothetical protein
MEVSRRGWEMITVDWERELEALIEAAVEMGYDEEEVGVIARKMRADPAGLFRCMPSYIPFGIVTLN